MEVSYQPAIVVIAYNRPHSLQRILNSLDLACCPRGVKLIISIDNNGNNKNVLTVADEYIWKHGEKEVIYHEQRLGLRGHTLVCGDLAYQYGSVILLEEDLVVSPCFYQYAQEALNYYKDHYQISGISLHNLPYTEAAKLPFIPLIDDSDVYFMQVPCTLGLAMSVEQWDSYKQWYLLDFDLNSIKGLPTIVTKYWSKSSWKKYLYGYMVVTNRFFLYPILSLTSNFNDRGENMYAKSYVGQQNLQLVQKKYKFKSLNDSLNVYDAYNEILPDRLQILCQSLRIFDFEVDLYGQKETLSKEYVITSKKCKASIKEYDRAMKPIELNIVFDVLGNVLKLAKKDDVIFTPDNLEELIFKSMKIEEFIKNHEYFYTNVFDSKVLLKILIYRLKIKVQRAFRFRNI